MKLSIVIPAYNEEARMDKTLGRIKRFVLDRKLNCEIIVVDDGSSDSTYARAQKELQDGPLVSYCVLRNEVNRGKGFSVRRGILEASGDFILFTDADLSTPLEEWDKLREGIEEGYDLAIGSRALPGSQVEVHQNILRESMGKTFNLIARVLSFKDIRDSQCGFKLFKKEAAHRLFQLAKIDGFAFDAEIIYLAQTLGYKVKEVPVVWRNSRASKVRILRDPLKMIGDLFRIRFFHGAHDKNRCPKI